MERTMWTDERLEDRFNEIDRRFDGVDRRLDHLDHDVREIRSLMFQLWGATMLGIFATMATVIATSL